MNRTRRRPWTLSPRELPHPSVIKDEPLLQDMENNAAYRMLKFRAKRRKPLDLWQLGDVVFLAFLIRFGWTAAIIFGVVLFIARATWRRAQKHQTINLRGLDRQILADLNSAAVHPQDIIGALWASVLPRRPRLFLYYTPLVLTLIAICLVAYEFDPVWIWIGIPFLLAFAHSLAEWRHLPYRCLPELEKIVKESALVAGCWVPPPPTVRGCMLTLAPWIAFVAICVTIGLIALNPPSVDVDEYFRQRIAVASHPATVTFAVVVSIVLGFLIGDWYGKRLKRRSEKILARLQKQIWKMLCIASEDLT